MNMTSIKNVANCALATLKKHSPEILVFTGIAGTIAGTVMACKATTKLDETTEKYNELIEKVHVAEAAVEEGTISEEVYSKEDIKKDIVLIRTQEAIAVAKLYAPSVFVELLGITSTLAGFKIIKNRNVALTAAYATLDKAYRGYRGRVKERFGAEVEKEILHGLKVQNVEEKTVDPETGEEKTVTKTVKTSEGTYSPYAKVFDEYNVNYEKNAEFNLVFLKNIENWANNRLKSRGYLFLNEVYEALGFDPTKAGQVVGWVYNPKNCDIDSYVDFGLYDIYRVDGERKAAFINGNECSVILDFNVDGEIWSKLPEIWNR